VRVRLAVRSREGDRQENIPAAAGGPIYRYALPGPSGIPPTYARVRTVTTDISLPNLTGVAW
jgi:hypothetical protein